MKYLCDLDYFDEGLINKIKLKQNENKNLNTNNQANEKHKTEDKNSKSDPNDIINNEVKNSKPPKEILPFGCASLDDNFEIFSKFEENTKHLFKNNIGKFSPVRPTSPKNLYDSKNLQSPKRNTSININLLASPKAIYSPGHMPNSPGYIPNSPHRVNSPIYGLSPYDDYYASNFNERFALSPNRYNNMMNSPNSYRNNINIPNVSNFTQQRLSNLIKNDNTQNKDISEWD